MPTRNINLTDHFDQFIEAGVAAGRYQNASEVVRAALRLLEQQEVEYAEKRERFLAAVQEGIDAAERGEVTELDEHEIDDFIGRISDEVEERARQRRTGT
ncbi:MAG TPA: type II toxin-antitoxin system ParD family antitoxin [Azospirillum sp.]|nr:type II toxin-antitoxin system ParD family antitoxin [Azospirillum sp.]